MNLGKLSQICRIILLVYLGLSMAYAVVGLARAYGVRDVPHTTAFVVTLALRGWFVAQVFRSSKGWIAAIGVFLAGGVVLMFGSTLAGPPAWSGYMGRHGWIHPISAVNLWLNEAITVVAATCCWILYAELRRATTRTVAVASDP